MSDNLPKKNSKSAIIKANLNCIIEYFPKLKDKFKTPEILAMYENDPERFHTIAHELIKGNCKRKPHNGGGKRRKTNKLKRKKRKKKDKKRRKKRRTMKGGAGGEFGGYLDSDAGGETMFFFIVSGVVLLSFFYVSFTEGL